MSFMNRFRKQVPMPVSAPPPYTPTVGGAGGFTVLRDPVAPRGANPKLWSYFLMVDVDRSGSISASELQSALVNGDWTPFDLDTVKLLMNLFDTNRSGAIDFNEFSGLWRYIEDWQRAFRHFDKDRSGTIDRSELQKALNQFGMNIPPHLLSLLVAKFTSSYSGSGVGDQTISFDRFLRACVFMKQFTEAFANLDTDKDGWVGLDYELFLTVYFSLP